MRERSFSACRNKSVCCGRGVASVGILLSVADVVLCGEIETLHLEGIAHGCTLRKLHVHLFDELSSLLFGFGHCVGTIGFDGKAEWWKSKRKCSVLHKSSIEEISLNLALNPPFCQIAVMLSAFFLLYKQFKLSAFY